MSTACTTLQGFVSWKFDLTLASDSRRIQPPFFFRNEKKGEKIRQITFERAFLPPEQERSPWKGWTCFGCKTAELIRGSASPRYPEISLIAKMGRSSSLRASAVPFPGSANGPQLLVCETTRMFRAVRCQRNLANWKDAVAPAGHRRVCLIAAAI